MAELLKKVDTLALTKRDEKGTSALGGVLTIVTPLVALAALIVLAKTPDVVVVDVHKTPITNTTAFPVTFSVADPTAASPTEPERAFPARYAVVIDPACAAANGWPQYQVISKAGGPVNAGFCGLGFQVFRNFLSNTSDTFCQNGTEWQFGRNAASRRDPQSIDRDQPLLLNGQAVPLQAGKATPVSNSLTRFTPLDGVRAVTAITPSLVSMGVPDSMDVKLPFIGSGYAMNGPAPLTIAQALCPNAGVTGSATANEWNRFLPATYVIDRIETRIVQNSAIAASIGGAWQLIFSIFGGVAVAWVKLRPKFGMA